MSVKPTSSAVKAWASLVRTEQALLDRVEDNLKRAGFPPLAWYDLLYEIDRTEDGALAQSTVQARMLLAQYNLCRLVDRLEREDLVVRRPSPVDGRSNMLHITEKGRALRRSMWPVYASAIEAHVGSRLSEAEAATLADLLGKLMPQRQAT
jgi:DNA-binding MarR family transcriptional regulator